VQSQSVKVIQLNHLVVAAAKNFAPILGRAIKSFEYFTIL
jgi:hypothetical protein